VPGFLFLAGRLRKKGTTASQPLLGALPPISGDPQRKAAEWLGISAVELEFPRANIFLAR